MKFSQFFFVAFIALFFAGCGACTSTSSFSTTEETGQQVGDAMASVDEIGGSSGSFAIYHLPMKTLEKLYSKDDRIWDLLIPSAYAAACTRATTFSSCSNNVITRTFNE